MKQLSVEQRNHPVGEQGIRSSLEEVAKRAAEGGLRPDIRRWSIDMLDQARKRGESVSNARGRARVLLAAVQEKLWVPDPVGSEFIQGAHLTACTDKDSPCFQGGDCDDLVVLLGAAFLSVGIDTMIVGHSYTGERQIGHVLAAAYVDNKWHYADPSPVGERHQTFGVCLPFTRERIYSLPNVQVVCDANACLSTREFNPDYFVEQGVFVGVNGAPEFSWRLRWLGGSPSSVRWLGGSPSSVRWLGDIETLGQQFNAETETLQPRQQWTITDKILFAGLALSVLDMGVSLWKLRTHEE